MKEKLKQIAYWLVKNEGMHALVSAVIFVALLIWFITHQMELSGVIQVSLFFSVLAALFVEVLATVLAKIVMNRLEDSLKLDVNYERICKRYSDEMIVYDNQYADKKNLSKWKRKEEDKQVSFPVVEDVAFYKGKDISFSIDDSEKMYELPAEIKAHFSELFQAHDSSNIYNQLNIRVDDWWLHDNLFQMKTSRTTYFNSLVTNRSMDFKWENGMTTRDVYEYGPYIPKLSEEKLSNHLGFNGFVESSDGYIPFIKRKRDVSIGKSTYGDSVGASLKTKYALNEDLTFTTEGLTEGILSEIADELKIKREQLEPFSLEKNLISAYRDMVEGGKPQLLFWAKSKLTHDQIEKNFMKAMKEKKKRQKSWNKEQKELEDGKNFLWIAKDDLKKMVIAPDKIIYKGKKYAMMPSASAAIVMLLQFLHSDCENK